MSLIKGGLPLQAKYTKAEPSLSNRFSFRPGKVSKAYTAWIRVTDLAEKANLNGPYDARDEALFASKKPQLVERFSQYFDNSFKTENLSLLHPGLAASKSDYDPYLVRANMMQRVGFDSEKIIPIQTKPFDRKFFYAEPEGKLCCRASPELLQHVSNNRFFITRSHGVAEPEGFPMYFASHIVERDFLRGHARHTPIRLGNAHSDLLGTSASSKANLSPLARAYLNRLDLPDPDADKDTAELIWLHALAIGYSPAYLADNADGIRENWPRVPLPESAQLLRASAALGLQVAALLDTETPVVGVTTGAIRSELKAVAVVTRVNSDGKGTALQASEFALTAGWGSFGKAGVTMPGKGRAERTALRQTQGERNNDEPADGLNIFLNDHAYWQNVPQAAWDFTIGGYQVMKKWLSYREERVLGRALLMEEMTEVTHMARRLTALVDLQAALDENYEACAASVEENPTVILGNVTT